MERKELQIPLNVFQRSAIITLHKDNKFIGYLSQKLNYSVSYKNCIVS